MYYYGRSDSYLTFLGDEPNTDVVASRGHNLQRGARHTHLSNLVQGHATSFSIPLNSIVSNQRRHQKWPGLLQEMDALHVYVLQN